MLKNWFTVIFEGGNLDQEIVKSKKRVVCLNIFYPEEAEAVKPYKDSASLMENDRDPERDEAEEGRGGGE